MLLLDLPEPPSLQHVDKQHTSDPVQGRPSHRSWLPISDIVSLVQDSKRELPCRH